MPQMPQCQVGAKSSLVIMVFHVQCSMSNLLQFFLILSQYYQKQTTHRNVCFSAIISSMLRVKNYTVVDDGDIIIYCDRSAACNVRISSGLISLTILAHLTSAEMVLVVIQCCKGTFTHSLLQICGNN